MKIKFSIVEKKAIRTMLLLTLIQFLIIFYFVVFIMGSQPIDINNTKKIDITVDDMYITREFKGYVLYVIADSKYYLFPSRATFEDYSVHELYNSISKGDRLSLICYESSDMILGEINIVVDARTESVTYRSFDEYTRSVRGVPALTIILFIAIEIVFVGIIFVYVWLNYNTIKGVYRKTKKMV